MRLCCGLMEGQLWDAALQTPPDGGPDGGLVVVLSNEEIVSPADAEWGEFSIVEATEEERAALKHAGYSMPDWTMDAASACLACHGNGPETEDEAEEPSSNKA